jgi:sulfur transfer protein SufE
MGLVEGLNNITVAAYDGWGNCGSDQIALIADFTRPTANLLAPTDGTFLRGSLSIICASYDDHLDHTELNINGETKAIFNSSGTYVYDWDTALFEDGNYMIRLVAYDKAGNNASSQITVNVDNSSPSVEWLLPASGSYASGTTNLTFSFSDLNLLEAKLTIDGQNLTNVTALSSYLLDTNLIAEGPHTLALIVSDKAGNLNSTEYITIIVDNTLPIAKILAPEQAEIVRGLCVVRFTVNDANLESAILRVDATAFNVKGATELSLNTTEIPDENCTITLTVTDKAGNTAVDTITFETDNTKPSVSITNSAELSGADLVGTLTIRFNSSDKNMERAVLYINETVIDVTGQTSFEWNTTTVGDGMHLIRLVAYDKVGNMAETPALSVKTVNVEQSTKENYLVGWDLGLRWGSVIGLSIGLAIGLASLLILKKRKASTA